MLVCSTRTKMLVHGFDFFFFLILEGTWGEGVIKTILIIVNILCMYAAGQWDHLSL